MIKPNLDRIIANAEERKKLNGGLDEIIEKREPPLIAKNSERITIKLKRMKKEAQRAKERIARNWNQYPDFYRGLIQWPKELPSYRVPALLNIVQQIIERKAAMLSDAKPIMRVYHNLSEDAPPELRKQAEDVAQVIEKYIENIWYEHALDQRLCRALVYAQVFGSVGFNTVIDRERGKSGPDPTFFVLDPRCLLIDPFCQSADELYKASYIAIEDIKDTEALKVTYPQLSGQIKPTVGGIYRADDYLGTLKQKVRAMLNLSEGQAIDRTDVTAFWLKDYSLRDIGGDMEYPNGRYILLAGEDVILEDRPNPFIDGAWPIDFIDWHHDLNSIWGFGDVEIYKSPQEMLNKLLSLLLENAALMTNSIWVGDSDALTPNEWKELVNRPGLIVKKRIGRELKREAPPPLSSGLFNMLEFLLMGTERISGIPAAAEGRKPGDVTSGVGIDALQSAAQVVIRMKARQLETIFDSIGRKMCSRVFQYIDDARLQQVVGDPIQVLNLNKMRKSYLTTDLGWKDFVFKIVPGSGLQNSKYQQGLQTMQLYQMGVIKGRKRVLDALNIPNAEDIEAENQQIEAVEQQMMMQQQMMAGGGKPPDKRGTGDGPGGRRNDQLPRPQTRSPETGSQNQQ